MTAAFCVIYSVNDSRASDSRSKRGAEGGGGRIGLIQIYLTDARALSGRRAECLALLPPGRRREAGSFREEEDGLLCCAAGLLLRRVLGVRADGDLVYSAQGKPGLAGGDVQFSLSHGGSCAALAVSGQPVGVDVEPQGSPAVFPRRAFTREELDYLERKPEDFCLLWTRLESGLKAEGAGFAGERNFSLLHPGAPWHWESLRYGGHLITCAADSPVEARYTALSAGVLLDPL